MKPRKLTKEELIQDAINFEITKAQTVEEAEKEFTCFLCVDKDRCPSAFDGYNLNGDCLETK